MDRSNNKTLVAIYARASTKDNQDVTYQLQELRRWAKKMGYTIYQEYIDRESGTKGRSEREQFAKMFQDAAQRKFDLLVFWALDRFTREGLQKTIYYLQQLDDADVKFHSYTEPYINTDHELARDILISVLASLAKQEHRRISERTKAGLETAKRKGQRLGAPTKAYLTKDIEKLVLQGLSKNAIAKKLRVSRKTVLKYYPPVLDLTNQ